MGNMDTLLSATSRPPRNWTIVVTLIIALVVIIGGIHYLDLTGQEPDRSAPVRTEHPTADDRRPASSPRPSTTAAPRQPGDSASVYQWVDSKGRIHYGDAAAALGPRVGGSDARAVEVKPNVVHVNPHIKHEIRPRLAPEPDTGLYNERIFAQQETYNAKIRDKERTLQCERVKREIKQLRERWRLGYTVSESNALQAREIELKARRHRFCD